MSSVTALDVVDNIAPADTIKVGWDKFNAHYHEYDASTLANQTGGSLAAGDVVAISTANDGSVILGDIAGSYQKFVVAQASIASLASGECARSGYVTGVKAQGTINRGEYVRKSATSKAVETTGVTMGSGQQAPRSAIGVACTAASGSVVTILLFDRTVTSTLPRNYIAGLQLANNGGDPNNSIDFGVGECRSDDQLFDLVLAATMTKQLNNTWAAGSAAGGLFSGVKTASTWYHCFVIGNPSTGAIDAGFDTSPTAANAPSGWTKHRRVGSILTDGGPNIIAFHQYGDDFRWDTLQALDLNAAPGDTLSHTITVTVPPDFKCEALLHFMTAAASAIYVRALDAADVAASATATPLGTFINGNATNMGAQVRVWTNTLKQIAYRETVSVTTRIATVGWKDQRGKDA